MQPHPPKAPTDKARTTALLTFWGGAMHLAAAGLKLITAFLRP